jgi:phosphoenolpyruvate synthase/pyruvate phosphate dikinase
VYADPRGTQTVPTTPDERGSLVLADDDLQELAWWSVAADKHVRRPMTIEWATMTDVPRR